MEAECNLGQAPPKGLFMPSYALRCTEKGKAVAFPHLLILMELSEPMSVPRPCAKHIAAGKVIILSLLFLLWKIKFK